MNVLPVVREVLKAFCIHSNRLLVIKLVSKAAPNSYSTPLYCHSTAPRKQEKPGLTGKCSADEARSRDNSTCMEGPLSKGYGTLSTYQTDDLHRNQQVDVDVLEEGVLRAAPMP